MTSPRRRPPADDAVELLPLDDAGAKITAFFSSLGDESTVNVSVYAIDPKDRIRGRSFLFSLPSVAELTGPALMEQVLAKYGAGEYLAEGRDAEGKLAFSPRFTVGPLKGGRVEIPAPATATAAASTATSELAAILAQQNKLLEALVNRPAPSLAEQLKDFAALRELFAPPPPPPALDLSKLVETVTGVLKLRDELGDVGGGDSGGVLGVMARALAPALTKIAERAIETTPALPAPAGTTASSTTRGSAEQPPAPPAEGADVGLANSMLVKAYVGQIVELAERGTAPADAAKRIASTLAGFPEPMVAGVLEWLDDERVVDLLAAHDPRVRTYAPWIEETIDALLELATVDDAAPATPANGTHASAPN